MLNKDKITAPLLTRRITAGAKCWMLASGFKPVVDEVAVASEWVADLAGYIYPTNTELKRHLKLLRLVSDGIKVSGRQAEWEKDQAEIARFLAKYSMPLTALVEVKVSAGDFRKDMDRKYTRLGGDRSPAHLSYLAFPRGIVPEDELPWYWGRLEFSCDGTKLLKAHTPLSISPQHPGDTIRFIAAIGDRYYNKWAHREFRELVKNWRAEERVEKKRWKTTEFLRTILDTFVGDHRRYIQTTSLAERLQSSGMKFTANQIELCEELEQLAKVYNEGEMKDLKL